MQFSDKWCFYARVPSSMQVYIKDSLLFMFFFLYLDREIIKQPCRLQNAEEKKKEYFGKIQINVKSAKEEILSIS